MKSITLRIVVVALLLLIAVVVFVRERRTSSDLRVERERLATQLTTLASENALLAKARADAEALTATLQSELATHAALGTKLADAAHSPASSPAAPAHVPPPAASSATPEKKAELHRRYDPFLLDARRLTPEQADRFVDLKIAQADARADLQAAVRQFGATGGTADLEALRSKIYEPILREMRNLLGEDGYAAYGDYEKMSFYRLGVLAPLTAELRTAHAALSSTQLDQLAHIVAAHDHPQRVRPTDLGTETKIDWVSVARDAESVLTPAQLAIIRRQVERQRTR